MPNDAALRMFLGERKGGVRIRLLSSLSTSEPVSVTIHPALPLSSAISFAGT
jgi:hypothetical protein